MYARVTFALAAGLLLISALVGVGQRTRSEFARSEFFWSAVMVAGTAVEHYDSLIEFAQGADLVVVGRLVDAKPGRVFGDPPHDAAFYIETTLAIEQVVFQQPHDGSVKSVTVEFVAHEEALVGPLVASLPSERALFFLRHNSTTAGMAGRSAAEQAAELPYWHVVNNESILRELEGRAAPLVADSSFIADLRDQPFPDVVAAIVRAASAERENASP